MARLLIILLAMAAICGQTAPAGELSIAAALSWKHWLRCQSLLPPTVGFYLLVLFAPENPLGKLWIALTGHTPSLQFGRLLVGSII